MNDDQIEDLLRHVRPAGPRPELRARIVGTPAKPGWAWMAAAAAMLLLTVALQFGAASLRQPLRQAVASASTSSENELTLALQTSTGLSENEARMAVVLDDLRFRIEQRRTNQEGRQP
jgi:hypothetical protein